MTFERHDYREGNYECNDCKRAFQNDKHWLCILCSEDICHQCASASALSEPEQDIVSRPTLLSWAEFTRQPRLVLKHLVRLGCKQEDWGAEDWNLSQETWNLIWTGASALHSAVPILMENGNISPARLPMERRKPISTKNTEAPNFYLPDELRASQAHEGKQTWRPLIPRVEGLGLRTRALVQKYIDLIDLNDIGFNPEQLAPGGILHYQTSLTNWLKWIDSCETDLVLRDAQGNPREDEKHMVGCAPKAGTKAHFDAVNHTGLIKSLRRQLEEPSTISLSEAKAWWQEICARLHPFHRGNWQESVIDPMFQAWTGDAWRATVDSLLDHALKSQMESPRKKRQKARQDPAVGATNIHNLGEALVDEVLDARMQTRHTLSSAPDLADMEFLVKIRRCSPESCRALLSQTDKFLCDQLLRAEKIKGHTGVMKIFLLPEDWFEINPTHGGTGWWAYPVRKVVSKLCAGCNKLKLEDQFSSSEWKNNKQTTKRCLQCPPHIYKGTSQPQGLNQRPRQHAHSNRPVRPDPVPQRKLSTRNKGRLRSLEIRGSSDTEDDDDERAGHVGILFRTADPRYTVNPDDPQGGDTLLDIGKIRELLISNSRLADSTGEVWLSSREMGYDITEVAACSTLNYRFDNPSCPHCRAGERRQPGGLEELNQQRGETADPAEFEMGEGEESVNSLSSSTSSNSPSAERPFDSHSGCPECRAMKVCLAPAISDYIRQQAQIGSNHLLMTEMKELDLLWGSWPAVDPVEWVLERGQDGTTSIRPHMIPPQKMSGRWESSSTPLTASDPDLLPNNEGPSLQRSFMEGWRLDGEIPMDGGIRVLTTSMLWEHRHGDHVILSAEGLSSNRSLTEPWTIMSSTWNHLQHQWEERVGDLIPEIHIECKHQDKLEEEGYRSPSWRVLRALKDIIGATRIQGESMITAPPFFTSAFRGDKHLWGHTAGPTVYLWESLSDEDRKICMSEISANHKSGWIILCRQRPNTKSDSEDETGFKKLGALVWSSRKPKLKGQRKLSGDHSEHSEPPLQDSIDGVAMEAKGRGLREKGWWKRGKLDLNSGNHDMACWANKSTLISKEMLENLNEAWYQESEKDECTLRLDGPEREYWLGTEVGRLGGYECNANTMATDGSEKGNMGAGCVGLNNDTLRHNVQIGRSEEGAGSNRPEMGALAEALRIAPRDQALLLFCDSENTLNTILKWVGEGARVALHHCADSDILREVLKLLHERYVNKASTFLIKVKAHRGEPLNEDADTEAELGRENECIIWNDRTNRMVYSWTDKHGKHRRGTWSRGVRQAFKWGAAHAYLQKSLGRLLPKWKATSTASGSGQLIGALRTEQSEHTFQCLKKLRNHRLGVMENSHSGRRGARQILLEDGSQPFVTLQTATKELQAFDLNPQFGPFMSHTRQERIARALALDILVPHRITEILRIFPELATPNESWLDLFDVRHLNSPKNPPARAITSTFTLDFLLRTKESRAVLGSVIRDRNIRHQTRRRLIQVITGTFPTGQWLHKIGKHPTAACELCRKAYIAQHRPVPEYLPIQSMAHIQSAECLGMTDMVTKAHHLCWEELQQDLMKNSHARMKFITIHKEMSFKTLISHEDFVRELELDKEPHDCLEEIWNEARGEEMSRELTEEEKTLTQPLSEQHYKDRFWRRRPDGMAVNWKDKAVFILEFTRPDDSWDDFITRTEERKNERYGSFVNALTSWLNRKPTSEEKGSWRVEQINFTTGVRGSIDEVAFSKNLTKLLVPASKVKAIRVRQVRKALATLDTVLKFYRALTYGHAPDQSAILAPGIVV